MTKMSYSAGSSEIPPNLDSRIKKTECLIYQPMQNLNPVPELTSNHNYQSKDPVAVLTSNAQEAPISNNAIQDSEPKYSWMGNASVLENQDRLWKIQHVSI